MTDVAPAAAHATSVLHGNAASTAFVVAVLVVVIAFVLTELVRGNR